MKENVQGEPDSTLRGFSISNIEKKMVSLQKRTE